MVTGLVTKGQLMQDLEAQLEKLRGSGGHGALLYIDMDRFAAVHQEIGDAAAGKLLAEIASVQGKIRLAHLAAHLQQKAILSKHQAMQYDLLRGYTGGHTNHAH